MKVLDGRNMQRHRQQEFVRFINAAEAEVHAARVPVPLALAGTCAGMWLVDFFDRQFVSDGAGGLCRLCGRRRRRHDREYEPQSGTWHAAVSGCTRALGKSASRYCQSAFHTDRRGQAPGCSLMFVRSTDGMAKDIAALIGLWAHHLDNFVSLFVGNGR
jgi:hypothetical protein